jgi:hypothetical protein
MERADSRCLLCGFSFTYSPESFFLRFLLHAQDNGRSVPDLTASPGRAPHPGPGPMQNQHNNMQRQGGVKEPVLLQGDFRKVSGISSEIFRQIEAVENDHDPSTAAALDVIMDLPSMALPCIFHQQSAFSGNPLSAGRRTTWGDDCEGVGAALYWESAVLRIGAALPRQGRLSTHGTNGGDCQASWTDFG